MFDMIFFVENTIMRKPEKIRFFFWNWKKGFSNYFVGNFEVVIDFPASKYTYNLILPWKLRVQIYHSKKSSKMFMEKIWKIFKYVQYNSLNFLLHFPQTFDFPHSGRFRVIFPFIRVSQNFTQLFSLTLLKRDNWKSLL